MTITDRSKEGNNGELVINAKGYYPLKGNLLDASTFNNTLTTPHPNNNPCNLWLKLENNVTDDSGNSISVTNSGVTFTTGKVGTYSGVFDGSSYLSLNSIDSPQTGRTIYFWVYPTSFATEGFIFSWFGTDGVSIGTDGKLKVYLRTATNTNGGRTIVCDNALPLNEWSFVKIVLTGRSSNNQVRQEYEGKISINTVAQTVTSSVYTTTGATTTTLIIGAETTTTNFFTGRIDDFRIYQGQYEQEDEEFIYNSGTGTSEQLDISFYKTDDVHGLVYRMYGRAGLLQLANGTTPSDIIFDYTTDFSFGTWVKLLGVGAGTSAIMGVNFKYGFDVERLSDTTIRFKYGVRNGATVQTQTKSPYNLLTWYFLRIRYRASDRRLFFDINDDVDSTGFVTSTDFTTTTVFRIGPNGYLAGNETYPGMYISKPFVLNSFIGHNDSLHLYNYTSVHGLDEPLVTKTDTDGNSITGYEFTGKSSLVTGNGQLWGTGIYLGNLGITGDTTISYYLKFMLSPDVTDFTDFLIGGRNSDVNSIAVGNQSESTNRKILFRQDDTSLQSGRNLDRGKIYQMYAEYVYDSGTPTNSTWKLIFADANGTVLNEVTRTGYDGFSSGDMFIGYETRFGRQMRGVITKPLIYTRALTGDEQTALFGTDLPGYSWGDESVLWLDFRNIISIKGVENHNNTAMWRFETLDSFDSNGAHLTYDFVDEDNTTATLNPTTLTATFSNGQILKTKSMFKDISNSKTIIKASIQVDSNSGFTYRISANGGTNWETIVPNTEHTFTNQGSDLRLEMTYASMFTFPMTFPFTFSASSGVVTFIKIKYEVYTS